MVRVVALPLALLALTADSPPHGRGIFLTGDVAWPGPTADAVVYTAGDDDVVTLRGGVPTASIGPFTVRDSHRAIDVSRSAVVGRLAVTGLQAEVTGGCIRAHADVVVVRNIHCVMIDGPQSGGVNMPFGLEVIAAKTVSIEDSSFDGFQWQAPANRYWNGDGVTIEREVAGVQFRRVRANDNTDAGFDV